MSCFRAESIILSPIYTVCTSNGRMQALFLLPALCSLYWSQAHSIRKSVKMTLFSTVFEKMGHFGTMRTGILKIQRFHTAFPACFLFLWGKFRLLEGVYPRFLPYNTTKRKKNRVSNESFENYNTMACFLLINRQRPKEA
jgi:hypothetical protein